jgi:hypothetical protein
MSGRVVLLTIVSGALVLGALASCVPPPPKDLRDLGTVMDVMAQKEAEYGSMYVSSPLLADPNDLFQFDLSENSENFYQDAKTNVQGSVSEFQQEGSNFGLSASANLNPFAGGLNQAALQPYLAALKQNNIVQTNANTAQSVINNQAVATLTQQLAAAAKLPASTQQSTINAAISQYMTTVNAGPATQPASLPSVPTLTAITPPPTTQPTSPSIASLFSNSGPGVAAFAAAQSLNNSSFPLSITDRSALITAAGDSAVKAMFEVMGNPSLAGRFKDKRVLFGVSTISVNPGWRTRTGYAANVAIQASYEWSPARAAILEDFVKNPKVPADLRLRLAIDQDISLPDDKAASERILSADPELKCRLECKCPNAKMSELIKLWRYGDVDDLPDEDRIKKKIAGKLTAPHIPAIYDYLLAKSENGGPLVSAVSPLNDTQTLDLSSSYRNQSQVAINLAFAFQAANLGAQADAFFEYAKSLQQDFNTITPSVVANSYSVGFEYGFQVGPQLKAVQTASAGKYSGPGLVLDRQSFPALIAYGFEADDISPRIQIESDGKYQLMEPYVQLDSSHNWVPFNMFDPLLTESERLQLCYWLNQYYDRIDQSLPDRVHPMIMAKVRYVELGQLLFGARQSFFLPEDVISPPRAPEVLQVEPDYIELHEHEPIRVHIALEGADLDTVELDKITLASGEGEVLTDGEGGPRFVGGVIVLNVELRPSENPKPIVFALPTPRGGTFTAPIVPVSGSDPTIEQIAPRVISLNADTLGNIRPTDTDVVIVGRHLDLIDWDGIKSTRPDEAVVSRRRDSCNPRILVFHLHLTGPVQSLAFELPLRRGGSMYSPPILVTRDRYSLKIQSESLTRTSNSSATTKPTSQVPSKPVSFLAAPGNGKIFLVWRRSQGTSSYTISYAQGDGLYQEIMGITDTAKEISIKNGNAGDQKYQFRLAAVNSAGSSPEATAYSDVPTTKPSAPPAPPGLTASQTDSLIAVNWDASPGASSYVVKYGTISDDPYTVKTCRVVGTSKTLTGKSGTAYYFSVAAVDEAGALGSYSKEVKATPAPPPAKANSDADGNSAGPSASETYQERTILIDTSSTQPSDALQEAALNAATTQPSPQATKPNNPQTPTPAVQSSFDVELKASGSTSQPSGNSGP